MARNASGQPARHTRTTVASEAIDASEPRERLIEAAARVFTEQGFRAATVRDICGRAGVNISAVSYYFGDKDGLYRAVLLAARERAIRQYPLNIAGLDASAQLHEFCLAFLLRCMGDDCLAWHAQLMTREMVEPTFALDEVVEEMIRPHWSLLLSIVSGITGQPVTSAVVRDSAASVIGQLVMYKHCAPVLDRLYPQRARTREEIEHLADHIATFSIRAMAGQSAKSERAKASGGRARA